MDADPSPSPVPSASPIPPEALVAHAGFVRRLAGALLRDDSDADDAAQEALAAGVRGGPSAPGARATWLAIVVRRVAARMRRTTARRATREAQVARPETVPAADDVAAREETLRAVVAAIRRLDAPGREVVLLRHYDDLPPRVIAERLGVPVETVKSRLRRAHERLRGLLEPEGPDETERRRKALAGFAGLAIVPRATREGTATLAAEGATAVTGAKVVGLATIALLAVGVALSVLAGRSDVGGPQGGSTTVAARPGPTSVAPSLAAKPAGPGTALKDEPRLPAGWVRRTAGDLEVSVPAEWVESTHGPGGVAWGAAARPDEMWWSFEIRRRFDVAYFLERNEVLASGSRRVGGRTATWRTGRATLLGGPGEFLVVTLDGADGTDRLGGSPPVFLSFVLPPERLAEHRAIFDQVLDTVRFPGAVGQVAGVELTERDVGNLGHVIAPADGVRVLVVRGDGPLAGAAVGIYAADEDQPWTSAVTDDGGEATFPTGTARRAARIRVRAGGASDRWWPRGRSGGASELRYRLVCVLGGRSIAGRAFDAAGRPLASGTVRLRPISGPGWGAATMTDATGAYSFEGLVGGQYELTAFEPGAGPTAVPVRTESSVHLLEQDLAAHADLGSDAPDASWRLDVRLKSGTPVSAGKSLWLVRDQVWRRVELGPGGGATVLLPPGPWQASLPPADPVPLTVGGGAGESTWTVSGVRLAGTVRGLEEGDDAMVECRAPTRTTPESVDRVRGSEFTIEPVRPGPCILVVRIGARASAPRVVAVPEDRDLTGLVLDAP